MLLKLIHTILAFVVCFILWSFGEPYSIDVFISIGVVVVISLFILTVAFFIYPEYSMCKSHIIFRVLQISIICAMYINYINDQKLSSVFIAFVVMYSAIIVHIDINNTNTKKENRTWR